MKAAVIVSIHDDIGSLFMFFVHRSNGSSVHPLF